MVLTVSSCLVVSAVAQSLRPSVTAVATVLPDGRTQLAIHNDSAVSITAYVVDSAEGKSAVTRFSDSKLSTSAAPIAAGGETTFIVAQKGHSPVVTFRGALFSDGSTFGDEAWIQRLKNRRDYSVQAQEYAISDLKALASSAPDPAGLAAALATQVQARIAMLPKATSSVQSHDNFDHVLMFRTQYRLVGNMVKGKVCDSAPSMTVCADLIASAIQSDRN